MQNLINKQLGLISGQQHSYINRKYGKQQYNNSKTGSGERSIYEKPLTFDQWFLKGLRFFEAKGAEFELLPGMVKITWPGKTPALRTIQDFRREHEEYKQEFPSCH